MACGIKTSLASAHLPVDSEEAAALAQLDAQFGALFHTLDFQEGQCAVIGCPKHRLGQAGLGLPLCWKLEASRPRARNVAGP
jgi:hypothetical protein